ncbi:thioredoxin-like protein [Aspergillus cavernicola]|uniref:Thioredoxin-like protein n=1 Tax=Aspergillus cavernicola TaxID=176166 RepID=A0ABR4IG42_9EURO
MAIIPIEIISDAICPWCFIGYRSLEKTINLYKKTYPGGSNDIFEIKWKPYFLDQIPPEESVLISERMSRRMTPSQIDAAQTRLKRVGNSMGIGFRFGGYIGSSRLAHRVLSLAGAEGSEVQCRVSEVLFKYQFELERDVSDREMVIQAGVEGGLDEVKVREFLDGEGGIEETEREAREIREGGVQGVPHFVIGGEHHFDGAGDMGEFFEAFVAVREVV